MVTLISVCFISYNYYTHRYIFCQWWKDFKMEDLTDVYNDLIMEHSMNSYNKKKLPEADFCEIGHNPNCGDEISIELKLNGDII